MLQFPPFIAICIIAVVILIEQSIVYKVLERITKMGGI